METCNNCGKRIGEDVWDECDGKLTFDTDPYQVEINENYEKSWDCAGSRHESAMDI